MTPTTLRGTPGPVTLEVRRLAIRDVPAALLEGRRHVRALRRDPRVRFAALLGTAGPRFTLRDARPARWALLVSWADDVGLDAVTPWTRKPAVECARLCLRPLWARGTWSGRRSHDGRAAFEPAATEMRWSGPVLVLTHSTLRPRSIRTFHRRAPAIASEVARVDPTVAFGIGEAPPLRQGTISLWESADAVARFRRDSPAHRDAMRRSTEASWYTEELFVRMAVLDAHGSIDGVALA